jgi:hypothetical protein
VNHGVAGAEGRAMRRKLAKPAERPRADAGRGLALLTLPVIAPPVGLLFDERPFV